MEPAFYEDYRLQSELANQLEWGLRSTTEAIERHLNSLKRHPRYENDFILQHIARMLGNEAEINRRLMKALGLTA